MPSGERLTSVSDPPGRKSKELSSFSQSPPPNHLAFCSGSAKAWNTASGGTGKVRSMVNEAWMVDRSVIGSFLAGRGGWIGGGAGAGGEELAQAVELALDRGPPGGEPPLGMAEAVGVRLVGADPADLLGADEPGP